MTSEKLFVGTTPGLEGALAEEAEELLGPLGARVTPVEGGIELEGPAGLYQEANLKLRIASRVLVRLAAFHARDEAALERGLSTVSLRPYWDGKRSVQLAVVAHRSRLSHTGQVRRAAERAWRLPPFKGPSEDALEILLRFTSDHCEVSVDSSGELLHRRGYRQEVSRAPLRETLAAGILRLAGYSGDEPLWDPMCGSGTIAIEGALIALRRPPGRDRSFAFQRWPSFQPQAQAWDQRLAQARSGERSDLPQPIWASDLNAGALGTARRNARRAGILEKLVLERRDAVEIAPPPEVAPGLLAVNLPYGVRVGEPDGALAQAFLQGVRRGGFQGWRVAIFAPESWRLSSRESGLELRQALDNGGIRCGLWVGRVVDGS